MRDNILKDIYLNNKVELSAMDVQLGVMQDVQKNTNILTSQIKELSINPLAHGESSYLLK